MDYQQTHVQWNNLGYLEVPSEISTSLKACVYSDSGEQT